MRTLCIALAALAIANGAWAQEPAAPAGKFNGPLVPGDRALRFFQGNIGVFPRTLGVPQPANAAPKPRVSRCAVPLIEMQAPKAGDPAILFAPRLDKLAPMPQAKLPPACEAPLTR